MILAMLLVCRWISGVTWHGMAEFSACSYTNFVFCSAGVAQLARALPSQGRGRGSESRRPLQMFEVPIDPLHQLYN